MRSERIEVRNGVVATLADALSTGYGIRTLVDGAWGFAASSDARPAGVDATAARAVSIARASAAIGRHRIGVAPARAYVSDYETPMLRDPADVSLGDRVALLLDAERLLHGAPEIAVGRAWVDLWRAEKFFYSTIGSRIVQRIQQTGAGLSTMAIGSGDVQTRSYPGDVGLYQSGGWEVVDAARLREGAPRIAEEAVQLLRAPQCPGGTLDIVLGGSQMSLQIHESCGHPAELDRVLGWEASFSGTSFLQTEQLGRLRYGSDRVTIVVDNTLERGMATCAYDDEGTPSTRSDIVRDG
ncbi:MAG: TldD/PmbA family protein, partial [Candidatus Eremiobacteraeota bacterium]|nr:TldD/PmbA family protein [Candidatus Eremiobacteraeota bacterium]